MEISKNLEIFLADDYNKQLINISQWVELFIRMYKYCSDIKDELIECIQLAGICSSDELRVYANIAKSEYNISLWQTMLYKL